MTLIFANNTKLFFSVAGEKRRNCRDYLSIASHIKGTPCTGFICPITACVSYGSRLATVVPGDSVLGFKAGSVFVGGFLNFFSLYSNLLIVRVLLSWFPAAQNQPLLRPLYTVCDPYLNLFRSVIPPVFGVDFSPIVAFTALQFFSTATVALGAEKQSRK
eukprot:jgi/Galph1/1643/GphlegSOOS_G328.1